MQILMKLLRRQCKPRVVLFLVAAGLFVSTLLTLPLASMSLAKYTTTATVTASARVAKWDVKFVDTSVGLADKSVFYIGSSAGSKYIKVQNDSEVAAKVTVKARWDDNDSTTGPASGDWSDTYTTIVCTYPNYSSNVIAAGTSGRTANLLPGGYTEFLVTVTGTTPAASVGTVIAGATNTRDTYRVELYLEAEQID